MTKLTPVQKAMDMLAFEIQRLPEGEKRLELEEAHSRLEDTIGRLPEAAAIAAFRALRALVTAARFAVAKADLAELKVELGRHVGLIKWNLSPEGERYAKWCRGYEASGLNTVEAYFKEAAAIAESLDQAIEKARQSRTTRGAKACGGAARGSLRRR